MTDEERDELIEKSILNQLDVAQEALVQKLRENDPLFRQEYEFQEKLVQQVQLKRRQELLTMFSSFEAEQADGVDTSVTSPAEPLSGSLGQGDATPVIPIGKKRWLWAAASIILAILLGTIVWTQLRKYDPAPIADDHKDSMKVQKPTDTLRNKPSNSPVVPQLTPQGPLAQQPKRKPDVLEGAEQLPFYETDDISLGFGKTGSEKTYRTVIFKTAAEPAYTFDDTLTVYLPNPPAAKPAWSLVYTRTNDTYYLTTGKVRYEIVKGLQGKQPLKKTN